MYLHLHFCTLGSNSLLCRWGLVTVLCINDNLIDCPHKRNLLVLKKIRNFAPSIEQKHKAYNATKKNEQLGNRIGSRHKMP